VSRQGRLDALLELVVESGEIAVDDASAQLQVSVATIRRDLDTLAERQLVNRTHGGATATAGSFRLPISYRIAKADESKQRIAAYASSLVSRHQVIGINGGTTTTEISRALAINPEFAPGEPGEQPALTVVTNALNIATELTVRHQIKIVVTGGVARPQSYELTGPYAEAVLNEVMIDIAFLGVESFNLESGAGARHEDEARVNRQIAARAKKVVVVTDSSKFERSAFAVISPVSDIDMIITDSGLSPKIIKELEKGGVQVVIT
jgi:DeoR family transcriptional regulator of aga operon